MISVIIPTLNEENHIGSLLHSLTNLEFIAEVIVVDGGSTDNTRAVIKSFPVRWFTSEKGRAVQMNAGAKQANGDILLFLHADSSINPFGLKQIPEFLESNQAGSFYLKFDRSGFLYNLYSKVSRLNWTIFTYGDQGLFMHRSVFDELGGFKTMGLFEDLEMVGRIKRKFTFGKLPYPILTSSRRFEKNGVFVQQLINIGLVALYYLGVNPRRLTRLYR